MWVCLVSLKEPISELFDYCKGLHEFEKPNFETLREKFRDLYFEYYEDWDSVWDWSYIKVSLKERSSVKRITVL